MHRPRLAPPTTTDLAARLGHARDDSSASRKSREVQEELRRWVGDELSFDSSNQVEEPILDTGNPTTRPSLHSEPRTGPEGNENVAPAVEVQFREKDLLVQYQLNFLTVERSVDDRPLALNLGMEEDEFRTAQAPANLDTNPPMIQSNDRPSSAPRCRRGPTKMKVDDLESLVVTV